MTTDPLHLDPIVERLAQEAWERANRGRAMNGADAPSHQSSLLCQFTRELVAVVAEECAKMCDSRYLWRPQDTEAKQCAEAIRARFTKEKR